MAYNEGLGAGGNPKNFKELLLKVDEQCSIIPAGVSTNGYQLFQELSNAVHGQYDEDFGFHKFDPLYRLVVGILDNIKNRKELLAAMKALGWDNENEDTNDK